MAKNHPKRAKKGGEIVRNRPSGHKTAPVEGYAFAESRLEQGGLGTEMTTRNLLLSMADISGLPNPDPILRAEGKSISTYRSMVDGHLSSVMGKRLAAVRARPWGIERGKSSARIAAKFQDIFDRLNVRNMVDAVLDANGMGVSLQEVIWGMDDWIVPERIEARPQEWFVFGLRGEVRFLDDSGHNEIVPPRKMLIARHRPDYLNPYGKPILSECFWPLAFKRGGLKFWMLFCEKFGLPKTVGKVPPSMPDKDKLDLLLRLESMVRAAAAVIPNNSSVELLETKVSGALPFPDLIRWADSEMSKAWLGETLSTEMQGNSGSRAAAEVHNQVRADLALDDANLVESVMNQLIQWIAEVNSITGPLPWFEIQMPEDMQTGRITRDQGLYKLGWRPSQRYFEDTYGIAPEHTARIDDGRNGSTGTAQDPGAAFGEADMKSLRETLLADLESSLDGSTLQDQADDLVGPVLELIKNAKNYGEVVDGLAKLIDSDALDTSRFEDLLARLGTLCEGIGIETDSADA